MKSSLGFHTITLFRSLTRTEAERLIKHFVTYQEHTGLIEMHMVKSLTGGKKEYPEYKPKYKGTRLILPPIISVLHSDRKDHGIRWTIRCDSQDDEYSEYTLEAKVNPKILGNIHNYITAADCGSMYDAIANFNRISRSISPLLGTFECYKFKRVDYCVNFVLSEIAPGCTSEQVIELIKRADIPSGYKMWMFYDETAHRMKSDPDSFYLKCGSVNINCYRKAVELQQRAEKAKGDTKEVLLEASRAAQDVIRFEVQCKCPKMYALSRQTGGCDFALNKYFDLLGDPTCLKQINDYYKSTIGGGDWFSLPAARRIVKAQHFNSQKEKRLLDTLYEVNRCRSLAMAKVKPQGSVLEAIKRSQKDLADIGINPVTIPREWGIKHIPNLLHTFYDISGDRALYPQMPLI